MPKARPCLNHPDQQAYNRGVCPSCYRRFYRMVQAGETTWAELEAQRQTAPPTFRKLRGHSLKDRAVIDAAYALVEGPPDQVAFLYESLQRAVAEHRRPHVEPEKR